VGPAPNRACTLHKPKTPKNRGPTSRFRRGTSGLPNGEPIDLGGTTVRGTIGQYRITITAGGQRVEPQTSEVHRERTNELCPAPRESSTQVQRHAGQGAPQSTSIRNTTSQLPTSATSRIIRVIATAVTRTVPASLLFHVLPPQFGKQIIGGCHATRNTRLRTQQIGCGIRRQG